MKTTQNLTSLAQNELKNNFDEARKQGVVDYYQSSEIKSGIHMEISGTVNGIRFQIQKHASSEEGIKEVASWMLDDFNSMATQKRHSPKKKNEDTLNKCIQEVEGVWKNQGFRWTLSALQEIGELPHGIPKIKHHPQTGVPQNPDMPKDEMRKIFDHWLEEVKNRS